MRQSSKLTAHDGWAQRAVHRAECTSLGAGGGALGAAEVDDLATAVEVHDRDLGVAAHPLHGRHGHGLPVGGLAHRLVVAPVASRVVVDEDDDLGDPFRRRRSPRSRRRPRSAASCAWRSRFDWRMRCRAARIAAHRVASRTGSSSRWVCHMPVSRSSQCFTFASARRAACSSSGVAPGCTAVISRARSRQARSNRSTRLALGIGQEVVGDVRRTRPGRRHRGCGWRWPRRRGDPTTRRRRTTRPRTRAAPRRHVRVRRRRGRPSWTADPRSRARPSGPRNGPRPRALAAGAWHAPARRRTMPSPTRPGAGAQPARRGASRRGRPRPTPPT